MTAVPVPPLTDEQAEVVQKRLEQSQRAYPLGSPSLPWAIRFYLEDMPRVLASLRAAQAELAEERRLADIRLKRIDQLESDQLEASDELRAARAERDRAQAELAREEWAIVYEDGSHSPVSGAGLTWARSWVASEHAKGLSKPYVGHRRVTEWQPIDEGADRGN